MKTLISKASLILFCTTTLLAFQNCGENKFSSVPNSTVNNSLGNDGDFPNDDDSPAVDEEEGEMEPVPEADAASKCNKFKADYAGLPASKVVTDEVSTNTRGSRVFMGSNVVISDHRGKAIIPNALTVTTSDTRGRLFARTGSAGAIDNSRGSLCVVAGAVDGDNKGLVGTITNHRGRLEVSGLDVGAIDDTRGPIVLRNVTVGSINNHRGSIRLINSTVGSITDHRGSVRYD